MKKISVDNVFICLCATLFSMVLSLSNTYTPGKLIVSCSMTFVGVAFLVSRFDWKKELNECNYIIKIISIVLSFFSVDLIEKNTVAYWNELFSESNIFYEYKGIIFNVVLILMNIFIYIYYTYIITYLYKDVILKLILSMDKTEKVICYTYVFIMALIIIYAYSKSSAFTFTSYIDAEGVQNVVQFDAILDCDSVTTQYDIRTFSSNLRHPTYSFVVLPEYVLARTISYLFVNKSQMCLLIFMLFKIIKLSIVGLCAKRLTGSKWIMLMLYTSWPYFIYGITVERHVDALFWLVIMVYVYVKRKNENYYPILLSSGANLVCIAITPVVIKASNVKEYIKKGVLIAVSFCYTIIITGNLWNIISTKDAGSSYIDRGSYLDNFRRFTVAIKSCFGGINIRYESYYNSYYDESGLSIFGILILVICVISFVVLRNNLYVKICSYWLFVCTFVFPVFGFSSDDYSMHMILFSWAVISLVVLLMIEIYNKLPQSFKTVALKLAFFFIVVQLAVNLETAKEILTYSDRFNFIK